MLEAGFARGFCQPYQGRRAHALQHFIIPKAGEEQISLREYLDCMKVGLNDIYYFTGESFTQVSSYLFLGPSGRRASRCGPW